VAAAINRYGVVAGTAENTVADPACPAPQIYQFKPVIWYKNWVAELPTGNDPEGIAFAINDKGQVVGATGHCAPFNPISLNNLAPAHAVLWENGRAKDLGNLGGTTNVLAYKINNRGEVTGSSNLAGDQTTHAFLWTPGKGMQDLGAIQDAVNNDVYSQGLALNDRGVVIGVSANADFSLIRAFIRRDGKLVDLNSLVSGPSSLFLLTACSINSKDEIIGIAVDPKTGETHGYLATPTHEAANQTSAMNR
jgi:probable HAF family extracellular repeat protein